MSNNQLIKFKNPSTLMARSRRPAKCASEWVKKEDLSGDENSPWLTKNWTMEDWKNTDPLCHYGESRFQMPHLESQAQKLVPTRGFEMHSSCLASAGETAAGGTGDIFWLLRICLSRPM